MSTTTLTRRPARPAAARGGRPGALRFTLLGSVEVLDADAPVTPRAQKPRALLAALVVRQGTVLSVDALTRELWGGEPPRTARQALHVYVSRLRRLLTDPEACEARPVLATQPPGYRIDLEPATVDVFEFERLHRQARLAHDRGLPECAARLYRAALGLWHGPALQDVRGGPLLDGAAQRLDEAWFAALERRIDVDLLLGRHLDLVAELRALTAEHPLHEGLHARLMVALSRSGRTGDALQVYRTVRAALVDRLGVEPDRGLQRVHQAVLSADQEELDRFGSRPL